VELSPALNDSVVPVLAGPESNAGVIATLSSTADSELTPTLMSNSEVSLVLDPAV